MATKRELRQSISRLRRLAQHLMKVPKELWNMHSFGDAANKTECKTACCVLGHAATVPKFKKLGLKWGKVGGHPAIVYNNSIFEGAGEKFFGLNHEESKRLFFSGYKMTRGQKIEHILGLIDSRKKEIARA